MAMDHNRTYPQSGLGVYTSRHRNILVLEAIKSLIEIYGRHIVYSNGGTWCPEAGSSLGHETPVAFIV